MGQQEIVTFLKNNKNKWFTSRQIADKLKSSFSSVGTCIKKLRDTRQIKYKKNKSVNNTQGRSGLYVYKH